jgi:signal transduction histidine kinase
MALSPTDEARGLKAYEQSLAFERLRTWRLPLTFIIFALIPILSGAYMWATGYKALAWVNFIAAILLSWMARFQWKQLVARHSRNLRLLAELKTEHGDALPWVQVENHFAELEKIKRELAEKQAATK